MPAEFHQPIPAAIAEAAAVWLARRDRGLTAAEQDEYMQWLAADARHAEALAQHAATLERMMQLYEWQPAHDTEPNPDLFAPPASRPRRFAALRSPWLLWTSGLAAAAAMALVGIFLNPGVREGVLSAETPKSYLRVNERLALPDGSRVELRDGSAVVVQYSDTERRVQLTGGEAHFSVWKDRARPFIVEVAGLEVKAIGTAFNVRLEAHAVEVLVTEGRIGVERVDAAVPARNEADAMQIRIGERVIVPLVTDEATPPVVTPVSHEEISRELAWQAPRLQFEETRLVEAIAEFNRLNRHQLELGESALGELRIGGTFRPDNVDGFVRSLGTTLNLRAESAGENRTVLRSAR